MSDAGGRYRLLHPRWNSVTDRQSDLTDSLKVSAKLKNGVSTETMSRDDTSRLHESPTWRARARLRGAAAAAMLAGALLSAQSFAQDYAPPPPPPGAVSTTNYSPEQLDQLVAPIALYPDDLLGQILMASTYPLEVVQADRWLQNPANASLRGSALAAALQQEPWDTSVKSLVAYPRILSWMDSSLDWTEATGDAFLAQQAALMDSVQRLRARAQSAGTLSSTPQEAVTSDGQDIAITSPDSTMEYVPVYNPDTAYGAWPDPDYPPYGFSDPDYAFGTYIAFPILVPYWGWDHWDWHHHRIDVDNGGGGGPHAGPGNPPRRVIPWRHDPTHRAGVPYRDPATRARFEGTTDSHSVQSNYRGYPTAQQPAPQRQLPGATAHTPNVPMPQAQRTLPPMPRPEAPRPEPRPEYQRPAPPPRAEAPAFRPEAPRPAPRPAPVAIERPLPPAMESFGRGEEVHVQEQRGASSRASAPEPAPAPAHGGGGRR
jgi:hypothetical protein